MGLYYERGIKGNIMVIVIPNKHKVFITLKRYIYLWSPNIIIVLYLYILYTYHN